VVAVNESRSAESHFEFEFEDVDVMMDGSFVDPAARKSGGRLSPQANAKKRRIDSAQVGSPTRMYVGVSSFVCRTPMAASPVSYGGHPFRVPAYIEKPDASHLPNHW
jgi:hypothetical protein